MKSIKSTLLLLAVLGIIGGLAWYTSQSKEKKRSHTEKEQKLLSITKDTVTGLHIINPYEEVELTKKNDQWLVATSNNYPADTESLEKAIDTLCDLKASKIASKNADAYSKYKLDNAQATIVNIKLNEDEKKKLYVGKNGPGFTTTYVRYEEDPKVYLIDEYLGSTFNRGGRTWRESTILEFPVLDVSKIIIRQPEETLSFIQQANEDGSSAWTCSELKERKIKTETIDRIIEQLSSLKADKFWIEEEFKTAEKANEKLEEKDQKTSEKLWNKLNEQAIAKGQELTKNGISIYIELKDDTKYELFIGQPEDKDQQLIKMSTKPELYQLSTYRVERFLLKDKEEYFEKAEVVEAVEEKAEETAKDSETDKTEKKENEKTISDKK